MVNGVSKAKTLFFFNLKSRSVAPFSTIHGYANIYWITKPAVSKGGNEQLGAIATKRNGAS